MKRLFLLLALFGVLATGCEELLPNEQKPVDKPTEQPTEDQTFFTDVEGNYVVGADGGEVLVIIATNLEYSIVIPEEAQSWLSVAETRAGERIDKRTFIVARNDSFEERSTTAELIGTDGEVLQSITFVQSGQTKVFETDSEGNYRVVANGGEVMVAVTTNLEYNIVISEDAEEWLSVADTRVVVREDELTFVVAVNESFEERSATVELTNSDGEVLQKITFIQDGQSKVFDSNGKDSYTIQAIGGEVNVVVTTNIEYNVNIPEAAQEWLSVADTRALAREETLTFIVAENETFEERSASVELVNGEGEVLQTIVFVQRGQTKVFESDGEGSYTIKAIGGEVSVAVTTNLEYSVVISEDAKEWLSVADTRAVVREEMLTFIVAENKAYDRRSTTVELVDTEGNVLQAIEFIQRAAVMPQFACPSDEIWYTNGSTTEPTTPYKTNAFGANILSNTYSEDSERWVIKFDGEVTTIGGYAFYKCYSLTSVTIPNSVTTIGNSAFYYCHNLTSVTIPDSVTTIESSAFQNCSSLINVYISDLSTWCKIDFGYCSNPLYCGANLYLNNKLVTELVIPSDITEVKSYTFCGCNSLINVTIPDSVATIGDCAFDGCSSLTSVTIPESVATIGNSAFYSCDSLIDIIIPEGVITIGNKAFYQCENITSVTIPDSVITIGNDAFHYCNRLKSVIIGNGVITIGYSAFSWCHTLTDVSIGNNVTTIGDHAFDCCCNGLTSITIPNSVTTIGNGAFANCDKLTEFKGKFATEDGRCLIVDGVLNSVAPAGLTEYSIPDSVTAIGDYAFHSCDSLTSVTIPDSVITIGNNAFHYCYRLKSIAIPDSVTTIGDWAFSGCSSLTSVTIPDIVTTIGDYAFHDCSSLISVYCKATTPPVGGSSMFGSNASNRKIYVPMESVDAYRMATYWGEYVLDIVGYNF